MQHSIDCKQFNMKGKTMIIQKNDIYASKINGNIIKIAIINNGIPCYQEQAQHTIQTINLDSMTNQCLEVTKNQWFDFIKECDNSHSPKSIKNDIDQDLNKALHNSKIIDCM